jgi:hypothetical protein
METKLPHSPSLLASWEIADRHPNQTMCPTRDCCDVLTEIAGQPGTDFSHRGERSTLYTVFNTLYKHLAAPFEFCGRIFSKWPPIRKSPIPLPYTPSSTVFYLYISGRNRFTGYGRTGLGDMIKYIVHYMGGILTEKPRTEDELF